MLLKSKIPYIHFLIAFLLVLSFNSCYDDRFSTDPVYKLEFSTDTLTFDTVFTSIGSATSKILVYNNSKFALNISDIKLSGGSQSYFKVNVDGTSSSNNEFRDVEIRANDSMYIFVQVTINPQDSLSPVFVEDSLVFLTNGVSQSVKLHAFGQDMELLSNRIIHNDTILTGDKPYLVYGYLAVDSAKTLTLNPGCRLYFHNNANLVVYGNLKAEGTPERPITLRGDRLDKVKFTNPFPYNYVAGQWGVVYLLSKYGNHVLKHVNINSGYVGIYFVNDDKNILPNLRISDSRIHNSLLYNLVAINGNVTVENSEISNSSSYCVYLNGGKHTFIQSTIVNYFNASSVEHVSRDRKPALMIMNMNKVSPMESVFRNCIISGGSENEFTLASRYPDFYKGVFDHCYIKKTDSLAFNQFTNIRWSQKNDTIFRNIRYSHNEGGYFNFTPDSVSPARGLADKEVANSYPVDLNGNNRLEDGEPDAGAYEWQPTK